MRDREAGETQLRNGVGVAVEREQAARCERLRRESEIENLAVPVAIELHGHAALRGGLEHPPPARLDPGAIGAYRGSCALTMSGVVDEVRIWKTALPVARTWSLLNVLLDREPATRLPADQDAWYAP